MRGINPARMIGPVATTWSRRRRRRFEVDDRPDWRDPNMQCFEEVLFSDGIWRQCYIPPEMKQQFARDRMTEKLTEQD